MDDNGVPLQLTAEAAAQLQEGINMVLSRWTALQMAVENQWGGRDSPQKANQLVLEIVSAFTQSKAKVYIDDLEMMIEARMLSLLNTEVDDGSVEEIALKLMFMHEECSEGNFNSIKVLRETNGQKSAATYVRQDATDDESSDDDCDGNGNLGDQASDMAIDAEQPQSNLGQDMTVDESRVNQLAEVEEDGWTKVSSRRNKDKW